MIKLLDRQVQMLRAIHATPRTLHDFSHQALTIHPATLRAYLDVMAECGLIDAPLTDRGAYTIAQAGRDWLELHAEVTPARRYCNFSQTEPYKPPKWGSPREAANLNRELYGSVGLPT